MDAIIRMIDMDRWTVRIGIIPDDYPEQFCRLRVLTTLYTVSRDILLAIINIGEPVLIEVGMTEWAEVTRDSQHDKTDPIYKLFWNQYRREVDMIKSSAAGVVGYPDVVELLNRPWRYTNASKYSS